ncbi:MAG: YgiT-type zinc finger protein [Chloroflexota bacterium]|nr:YgiT-type zinc finger protein [Chloroflexota bacterium]MCY3638994.1 YgiT-type zinc finger protein [Chloroflexota bacterium]MDE2687418.1 YgiT-type zinc finger protein [Chloroflexota bacterium]
MDCTIPGCTGKYESQYIVHTYRHGERIVLFDNVPAEVCATCGDTLLSSIAMQRIENMLRNGSKPTGVVPLYDFMSE